MANRIQLLSVLCVTSLHLRLPELSSCYPLDKQMLDLTFDITNNVPMFPGYIDFVMEIKKETGYGDFVFQYEDILTNSHLGTHVDAPRLFNHEGWSVDEIPDDAFHGPGVVIDVSDKVQENASYGVSLQDIQEFEEIHGRIPDAGLVFIRTGWDRYWNDTTKYVGTMKKDLFEISHPGLSEEGALWLATERNVSGVGVDAVSVDVGLDLEFKAFRALHNRNKWGISAVANLDQLPPTGLEIHVLPIKLVGASGSPCRILAFY